VRLDPGRWPSLQQFDRTQTGAVFGYLDGLFKTGRLNDQESPQLLPLILQTGRQSLPSCPLQFYHLGRGLHGERQRLAHRSLFHGSRS